MPSTYLQSADLAAYGVPNATAAQIAAASSLIDGYLQRPEGLIYAPDAAGNPCYMVAKSPSYSLSFGAPVAAGLNVVANVSGPLQPLQVGTDLVIDRANAQGVEVTTIVAISGNQITLKQLAYAHAQGATLEGGLTIVEQRTMPQARPLTTVSRFPLLRLVGGQGRYGYTRRGAQNSQNLNDFNLLASLTRFGGPPAWEAFDPSAAGVDPDTARVWVPAGIMLAYYSDVRLAYVAGYQYGNLPDAIKRACANLIANAVAAPTGGPLKMQKAGDTAIQRFTASLVDDDIKTMLDPYRTRVFA